MINNKEFYNSLIENNVDFFAGIPDSLLKDFNAYVMDNAPREKHIIAANEGNAVALAAGYHLTTGKLGLVYMQNSGLGNAVNLLTSLADKEVYSIPMLLLIGWRGQPGFHDEPQHVKQGRITLSLLETLEIPHEILPQETQAAKHSLEKAVNTAKTRNSPYALVVKDKSFEPYKLKNKSFTDPPYNHTREEALKIVLSNLLKSNIIVSTTGKLSRELFEYRKALNQGHEKDFLTVGSMGHSSSIALGIALANPKKQVYCLDGDGALIMHLGSLAIIGSKSPKNFKHIVFNNGSHESVGGQPTAGFDILIPEIAKACGYNWAEKATIEYEIKKRMKELKEREGPSLLEIRIKKGSRKDLGRPTNSPIENKEAFMKNLEK